MSQPVVVVQVSTNLGTQLVNAVQYGAYAVHPRMVHGLTQGPGWVVTHCASGLVVWAVEHYEEVVRVAEWLVANSWLPPMADREFLFGLVTAEPEKLAALREQLQRLAPRWPPA